MITLDFPIGKIELMISMPTWEDAPSVMAFTYRDEQLKNNYRQVRLNERWNKELEEFISNEYADCMEESSYGPSDGEG